jgi:hypothetical protein
MQITYAFCNRQSGRYCESGADGPPPTPWRRLIISWVHLELQFLAEYITRWELKAVYHPFETGGWHGSFKLSPSLCGVWRKKIGRIDGGVIYRGVFKVLVATYPDWILTGGASFRRARCWHDLYLDERLWYIPYNYPNWGHNCTTLILLFLDARWGFLMRRNFFWTWNNVTHFSFHLSRRSYKYNYELLNISRFWLVVTEQRAKPRRRPLIEFRR